MPGSSRYGRELALVVALLIVVIDVVLVFLIWLGIYICRRFAGFALMAMLPLLLVSLLPGFGLMLVLTSLVLLRFVVAVVAFVVCHYRAPNCYDPTRTLNPHETLLFR